MSSQRYVCSRELNPRLQKFHQLLTADNGHYLTVPCAEVYWEHLSKFPFWPRITMWYTYFYGCSDLVFTPRITTFGWVSIFVAHERVILSASIKTKLEITQNLNVTLRTLSSFLPFVSRYAALEHWDDSCIENSNSCGASRDKPVYQTSPVRYVPKSVCRCCCH